MAQNPWRWPADAREAYMNQYLWVSGDEEMDSRDDYITNGQRPCATSFNPGAGHCIDPGLQTTDGRAGPDPYDPSSNLQSPYHSAVGGARDPFAYSPPQQPYWGPVEGETGDLFGQHEGRIDGSSLPGPYGYDEPQPETSEPFRGTPRMPQGQGRDSPRSIDAEQGSDEYACPPPVRSRVLDCADPRVRESTARDPSDPTLASMGQGYYLNLTSDLSEPWSPAVGQGRRSREEMARDTNTRFDTSFSAVPSSSSGPKRKEKNHGQASGTGARRDGRQSGGKGSKSKSRKPHDERRH